MLLFNPYSLLSYKVNRTINKDIKLAVKTLSELLFKSIMNIPSLHNVFSKVLKKIF